MCYLYLMLVRIHSYKYCRNFISYTRILLFHFLKSFNIYVVWWNFCVPFSYLS
jgi:hypothetical protein